MVKKSQPNTQAKVETLTIRVSPKMKFGLELLARKQHRTLTSVAEWALSKVLKQPDEGLVTCYDDGDLKEDLLEEVWDPFEPDRLVKLALKCPQLLTYEEELLWKIIKEHGFFWKGHHNNENEWVWSVQLESAVIERIRDNWEVIKQVAEGKSPSSVLPGCQVPSQVAEMDIPF